MTLDDVWPILDGGSRVAIVFATVIVAVRLLNTTFNNSQTSWQQAADTLTTSAEYAKAETNKLRERVEHLEQDARTYAEDRAAWLIERARFTAQIAHLENVVTRLTEELATITDPRTQT